MTADRRIQAGFWLLALVPALLGFIAWQNARQLVAASQDVAATNDAVKKLEIFLSRLKDAQVAQREYVLTGDERYIVEIRTAFGDIDAQLNALPVRDNRHWIEHLRTLVPQKFEEIQRTIEARASGDFAAAQNTLLTDRGAQAMDDIGKVVKIMIDGENTLLQKRSADQNRRFINTMAIFVLFLVLNLALIWSLSYLVRRESRQVRKLVEERTRELQRSNEELQQFAYVASHDMREPMRMISSYATLLQRRYTGKLDEDADAWIGFLVGGVNRLNKLITDLLDYSKAGQVPEDQKQQIEPEQVLSMVIENLKMTIADSGASVTYEKLPVIRYEPGRLAQLLQNLVANAIKYRGERQPVVHISASDMGPDIVFSVRDNGIGIPEEHQEDIFAIFKRLHDKKVEGTGIGLATCKKIVEEHGGRIWVESEPGKGSTFRFTVPRPHGLARSAVS